jgi:hypothetical protein
MVSNSAFFWARWFLRASRLFLPLLAGARLREEEEEEEEEEVAPGR